MLFKPSASLLPKIQTYFPMTYLPNPWRNLSNVLDQACFCNSCVRTLAKQPRLRGVRVCDLENPQIRNIRTTPGPVIGERFCNGLSIASIRNRVGPAVDLVGRIGTFRRILVGNVAPAVGHQDGAVGRGSRDEGGRMGQCREGQEGWYEEGEEVHGDDADGEGEERTEGR